MENTIFLLNFREGRIEQIPESVPPRLWDPADRGDKPEELDHARGFVLAALGTPPEDAEE